ncbi:MAG: serine protease [Parachlamydiaceae bacterium]|nr:serine protease [Parachlamydiaceae bacterium]
MSAFLLLLFGMLLIFIEFFLPGAVMGTIGTLLVLASIYLFASETDSGLALVAYIGAVIIALIYLVKIAIWRMQKTSPQHTICSNASQDGYVASSFDESAVGKKGVVLSDLKPGGYILVDGRKEQAISVSGYIAQNLEVEVIGGQEESLLVKLIEKKS